MTKRLCTICARGGSKGVPGKNIRILCGKPMIAHSIEQARDSGLFEYISVSSDSDEILNIAKEYGADFVIKRPDEMATDSAGKVPAIVHAIKETQKITAEEFDTLVDLDATSPLRIVEDIKGAVDFFEANRAEATNVITVAEAHRSPYFNLVELNETNNAVLSKKINDGILCRQESPKCFDMNGSIYIWGQDFLDEPAVFYDSTRIFVMPVLRSRDVDYEHDFKLVELIMQNNLNLDGESYGI